MKLQQFLDAKHGKFIGRVYFLVLLFIGNMLIPVGAVIRDLQGGSSFLVVLGIVLTVISVLILSTPYDLSNYKGE